MITPKGSILNPSDGAAVIGGNVLTCQRVTDVVFRAFETCAASQGCMNNTTFGDKDVGYYETVAGGAGAVSFIKTTARGFPATINFTHAEHSLKHLWKYISFYYTCTK